MSYLFYFIQDDTPVKLYKNSVFLIKKNCNRYREVKEFLKFRKSNIEVLKQKSQIFVIGAKNAERGEIVAEAWRHSVRHGDDFDWPGGQDAHEVLPSIQTALIH